MTIHPIKQLDPHVADLIAAGEVVERPASVVKELLENAIDAGASAVTVEIARGGMALIRVTDNGCGIPADQAATAFLRHATSKIASQSDLEAIGTLGFRGEALAAIAAVSRLELLTKPAAAPLGTALTMEGGVLLEQEEAGCPDGTTMVVRDLFFNTPARLKFLKKDVAEGAAVSACVQRVALSHPELSVKFLRDGKQELLTPGDGQLKSAVYAVLGRDLALGLSPVKGSGPQMSVEGFVSLPSCCRGSRGYQHFFVNGRYVKSRVMMAALEEAYQNRKMVGRFPACVLHLTLRPNAVDVNVHPAKTEVKFQSEQQVFSTVLHGVQAALDAASARPQAVLSRPAPTPAADTVTPHQTSLPLHSPTGHMTPPPRPVPPPPPRPAMTPASGTAGSSFRRVTPLPPEPTKPLKPSPRPEPAPLPSAPPPAASPEPPAPPVAAPADQPTASSEPKAQPEPWLVRGELFRTYILVEQGDRVLLIDKHAAHERRNFDRLRQADYQPMVQELLLPLTFTPPPEERAVLLEQLPLLARFGFEVEEFGAAALAVRTVPNELEPAEVEGTLLELARRIRLTGGADPAAARDELLHTMACKAAIKGGQRNGPAELEEVAALVLSGAVQYCPHGRPVAIELTRRQLERQFKRT